MMALVSINNYIYINQRMGISITQLGIFLTLKDIIKDKKILAISVQYPPSLNHIKKFANQYQDLLSSDELSKIKNSNNQNFQEILFKNILGAKSIDSLDISDEEGATIIFNMNDNILDSQHKSLLNGYDFIFEGGTMEHISNLQMYLNNVFSLMKVNGYYVPNVPSTGQMEHGFYQFSPTFFCDLTFKNSEWLDLIFLGLDVDGSRHKGLSFDNFYEKTNMKYPPIVSSNNGKTFYNKRFLKSTLATGTLMTLLNNSGYTTSLLSIIKKTKQQNLDFNFTQYVYRSFSLNSIVGSGDKKITNKKKLLNFRLPKKLIKSIIINFPLSSIVKYRLILFVISFFKKN